VRIAPQQRQLDVEFAHQFRRHEAEQVGARGRRQVRAAPERALRSHGTADHGLFFQDDRAQAGTREQKPGHQAVVAGPCDDDVRVRTHVRTRSLPILLRGLLPVNDRSVKSIAIASASPGRIPE